MAKKYFRPTWWAILLVLVLGAAMIALGVWQLQRAADKTDLLARYQSADASVAKEVTAGAWSEPGLIQRGRVRGRFDGTMQLLLDNQSHNGTPGYHVWTPLHVVSGGIVMIDRGWIPAGGDRSNPPPLPVPEGEMEFEGLWKLVPQPGMRLEVDNCAGGPWPRIVQYPTVDELRCLYGEFVAGGILLMDPDVPGGFERDWMGAPELQPTKHYAYAAQWFAFALVLVGIFITLSFRPKDE